MLHFLSAGKTTQLHSFPDLETRFSHPHAHNERQDFYYAPDNNTRFVSVNPKTGFETLRRTVHVGSGETVQRLMKVLMTNISCAACPWDNIKEVALGHTNGTIRFYSLTRKTFNEMKFHNATSRQSVVSMAYSCSNELLGSIFEDGEINMFGLNTGVKMDSFRLDGGSTLIRFHPTRRLQAAIASEHGAVTVLDVSTKRAVYTEKRTYSSPCPDLCWSPIDPNMLLSVGYDCHLNVFDVRQKQVAQTVKHTSPFSCLAIARPTTATAGPFVVAGTLKGDLCAYDLRATRAQLAERKEVHDTQVLRVAFADIAGSDRAKAAAAANAEAQAADSAVVPNILGGGRRSTIGGAGQTSSYRRQSTDLRQSLGIAAGRPSMAPSTDGDGDQSSFDAFISKCTKSRDDPHMFDVFAAAGSSHQHPSKGGRDSMATRRDSLLDMEVRPVRFADISDSDLGLSVAGGGSRRGSLAGGGGGGADPVVAPPSSTSSSAGKSRRSSVRPIFSAICETADDDDDCADAAAAAAATDQDANICHVTSRKAQRGRISPRKILQDKQPSNSVLSSTVIDQHSPGMPNITLPPIAFDKENRPEDTSNGLTIPASTTAASRVGVAAATASVTPAMADLERTLNERLSAMEQRQNQRFADVMTSVEAMHFAVQTQLWCLEDTDLREMRCGIAETQYAVQMMSLSNAFVQEHVALKEENAQLRQMLAKATGAPAPKPFL